MAYRRRDVTGEVYGRLTVIGEAPTGDRTKHRWVLCQCSCGQQKATRLSGLRRGAVRSCGCLFREQLAANHQAAKKPLDGRRYGRLVVVKSVPSRKVNGHWHAYYECRCDCGQTVIVQRAGLTSRTTQSCGCLNQELATIRARKHGASGSKQGQRWPEYSVWNSMIQRCENPNNPAFHHYGGRGITVDDTWHTFATFIADMGRRPPGHSLDRIDNDGPYAPGNCRWTTRTVQTANRMLVNREEFKRLKGELARYKAKYGELPSDDAPPT